MAEKLQIYKCEICGNIIEVFHSGAGQLVCCDQPMKLMEEQTADWKTEKHVPVVTREGQDFKVVVGSTPHPMTEEHHIEWIEIITDTGRVYRKYLKLDGPPETTFLMCDSCAEGLYAREYCNVHGLWSAKK